MRPEVSSRSIAGGVPLVLVSDSLRRLGLPYCEIEAGGGCGSKRWQSCQGVPVSQPALVLQRRAGRHRHEGRLCGWVNCVDVRVGRVAC